MAFIRSGSNPEGLYIYGTIVDGGMTIYIHADQTYSMPKEAWEEIANRYWNYELEDEDGIIKFDDFYLTEDWVEDDDGRNHKIILGEEGKWHIAMWEVTWRYAVDRYRRDKVGSN
jgi:hypothetical protein